MDLKEIEERLLRRAYRYISFRSRSVKEINDYLHKKIEKYSSILSLTEQESIINKIISYLKEIELISDEMFVGQWVETRKNLKPKGKIVLSYELKQKGIPERLITTYFDEHPLDEDALALSALQKRVRSLSTISVPQKRYEKAMAHLMRKGFSYSSSKKAFEELFKKK